MFCMRLHTAHIHFHSSRLVFRLTTSVFPQVEFFATFYSSAVCKITTYCGETVAREDSYRWLHARAVECISFRRLIQNDRDTGTTRK